MGRVWKRRPETAVRVEGGQIVCSDALDLLRTIRDEVANVVFLDPPFNLGKEYGARVAGDDLLEDDAYRAYLEEVLDEAVRVLAPGGALYLYHLPRWGVEFGARLLDKLKLRHWIAVSMKNGFPKPGLLYPAHYALLYFTRGKPTAFERPKVPPPRCRKCDAFVKDYGGYRDLVADGINVSDIWDDFSPVRHPANKSRTANELPLGLLQRVLAISGVEGGLVVDPFVGSGTTAEAAIGAQMQFIVGDREEACCLVTRDRLQQAR